MKRKKKEGKIKSIRLAVLGICSMIFLGMPQAVCAGEKETTLTVYYHGVNPKEEEVLLKGAEFVLYRAGERAGNRWRLQGEFEKSNINVGDTSSSGQRGAAEQLYAFAIKEKINGITKTTESNGKAVFGNLEEGVYLCSSVSDIILEGYKYHSAPFLVFIPSEDGTYDVTVEPKSEWVGNNSETPEPVSPTPELQEIRPDHVKTGDNTDIWKPVALLLISIVIIVTGNYKRGKMRTKRDGEKHSF